MMFLATPTHSIAVRYVFSVLQAPAKSASHREVNHVVGIFSNILFRKIFQPVAFYERDSKRNTCVKYQFQHLFFFLLQDILNTDLQMKFPFPALCYTLDYGCFAYSKYQ